MHMDSMAHLYCVPALACVLHVRACMYKCKGYPLSSNTPYMLCLSFRVISANVTGSAIRACSSMR